MWRSLVNQEWIADHQEKGCEKCGVLGPCYWDHHGSRYVCQSCLLGPNDRFFQYYVGNDPGRREIER